MPTVRYRPRGDTIVSPVLLVDLGTIRVYDHPAGPFLDTGYRPIALHGSRWTSQTTSQMRQRANSGATAVGGVLVALGLMATLTLIGAPIGIPVLIAGIAFLFVKRTDTHVKTEIVVTTREGYRAVAVSYAASGDAYAREITGWLNAVAAGITPPWSIPVHLDR